MRLTIGDRLAGSGPPAQPGGYVVTGAIGETPWYGLYAGKKIFYNFDFTGKRPREADEKEWLDVCLRTIQYPYLHEAAYVAGRRALVRAEARRILGRRRSNLWPEPLDVLEVANTRDPFAFPRAELEALARTDPAAATTEPILVFAHPQGQALLDWQQNVLPLAALLGVLAELLDFVASAHEEGLLLGALSPHTVLIDRADRVHYLGSDLAVETSIPLPPEAWPCFFPPERYPRGFAAPECFTAGAVPDRRSDLYGWGTLAYFLLTGEQPEELAREQGQPWVRFQAAHLGRLEKALRAVPPAHVRTWGEELGIAGDRLVADWPGNLITVFGYLLSAQRRCRPTSVVELRSWLQLPPPPPFAALLALRTNDGEACLFLDPGSSVAGLEMVIRRECGQPPPTAEEGTLIAAGPAQSPVVDRAVPAEEDVFYAVFTRRQQGTETVSSVAASAALLEPTSENLRLLAEEELSGADAAAEEPPRVTLLFGALDVEPAAEALLGSTEARVRGWAVRRLASLSTQSRSAQAEALLWRVLRDPVTELRWQAARAFLHQPDEELLRRLAAVLGGDDPEERRRVVRQLQQEEVSAPSTRRALAALEAEQATTCHLCGLELPAHELGEHLTRAHDYLEVLGDLWPRPLALARLWDGVCTQGDVQAHHQLLELLRVPDQGAYVAALEAELKRRVASPPPSPPLPREGKGGGAGDSLADRAPALLQRLASCLNQEPDAPQLLPRLLRSAQAWVREIARSALVPKLRQRLQRAPISAADVWQELEQACPGGDLLEERILLCQRLAQVSVDPSAVESCLARLQEQRPSVCPECGAQVCAGERETHLRRAHHLFEFRGGRCSAAKMRGALLRILCRPTPDVGAWKALTAIARDEIPVQADRRIVSWLCQKMRALPRDRRLEAVEALAEAIVMAGDGPLLLPLLAAPMKEQAWQASARLLALAITSRLPPPLDLELVRAVQAFLADKLLPRDSRQKAVASLLRSTGKSGPAALALLRAYTANTGKLRAIAKLHQLEPFVGPGPAIDALVAELEDQVRMTCPRCALQLPRARMVPHLWEQHRLMLDGRRVREPWRVLEDWLEDYRLEKDAPQLQRCRDLAQRLEGQEGLRRLQQLMLRHGLEDPEALLALKKTALREHASLCPHCFSQVAVPEPSVPTPLTLTRRRLSGNGYRIKFSERGLSPRLVVQTPGQLVYAGHPPGRRLTRGGVLLLMLGPLILAAAVGLESLLDNRLPPWVVVLAAAGIGLLGSGLLCLLWPSASSPRHHLIDLAWSFLVPRLLAHGLTRADVDFLGGLAQVSRTLGTPATRAAVLQRSLDLLTQAAERESHFLPHLATLSRLRVDDLLREGEDPVPLLVQQLANVITGRLPLQLLQLLQPLLPGLFEQQGRGSFWQRGHFQRLQALLCERAFASGLGPDELLELGRAVPPLAALVPVSRELLAGWRLLWALRDRRPWERWEQAATIFELARQRRIGGKVLTHFPDLLLAAQAYDLWLCVRGVCFQGAWFTDWPNTIEVVARPPSRDRGFDLVIGPQRFWFAEDPTPLVTRLEAWFRFFFHELRPQLGSTQAWRSPAGLPNWKKKNSFPCPGCQRPLVPCLGEVGLALTEEPVAT